MKYELTLYNTLGRTKEVFTPQNPPRVTYYTCGPTVYHYAHLGNLRTYISEDVLHRVLIKLGYEVDRVLNITDVGHLQNDEVYTGEDKLDLSARQEGKSPQQIAEFYTEAFLTDYATLHN